jgi:hypothetical protein
MRRPTCLPGPAAEVLVLGLPISALLVLLTLVLLTLVLLTLVLLALVLLALVLLALVLLALVLLALVVLALALVLLALLTLALLVYTHVAFGLLLSALDLAVELPSCFVLYVLRSLVQALVHDVGVIVGEILRFVHPIWHGSPFPPVAPLVDVFHASSRYLRRPARAGAGRLGDPRFPR